MAPLPLAVVVALGVCTMGAASTITVQHRDTAWYRCVEPTWAPPRWVYPVVWTPLYAALTAALALSSGGGDPPWIVQIQVVNLWLSVLWCQLFFAERQPLPAAAVLLGILVVAGFVAVRTRRRAVRAVFVVYGLWCAFALLLNLGALQRDGAAGCAALAAATV